jgi:hypothetical protein
LTSQGFPNNFNSQQYVEVDTDDADLAVDEDHKLSTRPSFIVFTIDNTL